MRTFEQVTLARRMASSDTALALGYGVQSFRKFALRGRENHRHFADDMQRIEAAVALHRQAGNISAEEDGLLTGVGADAQKYHQAIASPVVMKQGGAGIVELDKHIKGSDGALATILLREMGPAISRTSELVQEITAASEGQSTGLAQINTAMSQIARQSASSSEELAATCLSE